MRRVLASTLLVPVLAGPLAAPLAAQEMVPATLDGFSSFPAATFTSPPADAPAENALSGRYLDPLARVDEAGAAPQRTGLNTPFEGQPVQGISGFSVTRPEAGGLWAVIDNGFGSKRNSPDALLSFVRLVPALDGGTTEVAERVWLRDPNGVVPFRIVQEGTEARLLTGGDFDTESIQVVGDQVWIGDEFGPFLISATLDGVVTGVVPAMSGEAMIKSPDNPSVAPGTGPGPTTWRSGSSGGFEGLALAPDGMLWALLEQPLRNEDGTSEAFLRLLQLDPATGAWTGEERHFAYTEGATAIGDINFISDTRALIIERDNNQGLADRACAEGTLPADAKGCFPVPAAVKRVTLVEFGEGQDLERLRQIDLMDIADPEGLGAGTADGRFSFPFQTIESVVMDGPEHILLANDNNLPFSSGRDPDLPDNNEMIRLHVPELLAE